MPALNAPMALPTTANVDIDLPVDRLPRDFDLILLIDMGWLDWPRCRDGLPGDQLVQFRADAHRSTLTDSGKHIVSAFLARQTLVNQVLAEEFCRRFQQSAADESTTWLWMLEAVL
jgi:hypothetical protein